MSRTKSGLSQIQAEELANAAHTVCPYYNAIKGNIDVSLNVTSAS